MKTFFVHEPSRFTLPPKVAATVGFFDGVHLGHRFLIKQLCKLGKEKKLPVAVITFLHHPRKVLDKGFCPELLNSFEEKLAHLASTGIDYCFVIDFTKEFSHLSARDFIQQILYKELNVKALLIGYDHRFGKDREEGTEAYIRYGTETGMDVTDAESFIYEGSFVGSTRIRGLLLEGNIDQAQTLLSYPYQIEGKVIEGNGIGRTIGFPTANIQLHDREKLIPGAGIYITKVYVDDTIYPAMLYIGSRPTITDNKDLRIEAYLMDFSGDLYGKELKVEFLKFLRKDEKFDSIDILKEQLEKDKDATKNYFSHKGNL